MDLYGKMRKRLIHLKHGVFGKMPVQPDMYLAELDKEFVTAVENAPKVHEKFAKSRPHSTLEENLLWSTDKNDIIFCVAQEFQSVLETRYISLDLNTKSLNLWSLNFEQCVLTKRNPFASVTFENEKQRLEQLPKLERDIKNLMRTNLTAQSYNIFEIKVLRRALTDPRYLRIGIKKRNQ